MKRHLLLTAFLVLLSPLFALAQSDKLSDEQIAVKRVVENYLGDDIAVKQRAIYADATITSLNSKAGKPAVLVTPFSKKPNKAAREVMRDSIRISPTQKIVAVDVAEGGAATVKVESEFAPLSAGEQPRKHFQYLSLLKLTDGWKIVSVLMATFDESTGK